MIERIAWAVYQLADDRETYGENAGRFVITSADLEQEVPGYGILDEDVAVEVVARHNTFVGRLCQALPPLIVGEGFNATCGRCWQPIDAAHHYMQPCSCATRGCWECGAAVGEPGCEYCVDRSEVSA